jgi:hypothetical protein
MRTTVSETMEKMNEQGVVQYAIDWLRDSGFIPEEDIDFRSVSERQFEDALNKLHGKWNRLSQEEEETIINISKRF